MSLPTSHLILVRRWVESATERDEHGNPVAGHGEPEELWVHSIAPGPSTESIRAGRVSDEVEFTILAPAGVAVDARDVVLLSGVEGEFQVHGDSRDWTRGPWPMPIAGVEIELSRKRG